MCPLGRSQGDCSRRRAKSGLKLGETWREYLKKKCMRKSADRGANVLEGTVKGIMKEEKGEKIVSGEKITENFGDEN